MATAPSPPILIWQPGGGFPGGPVSNPPVYSQAGTTPLIIGQQYVDVVFGSIQTTSDWVLVECDVTNTADLTPLNIWPGIITNRTAAGFRVYFNGLPDSGNYYLHWAVSGVNIAPGTASTYHLSGPASGPFGSFSTFTVALPPSTVISASMNVTLDDGGAGGTFSPNTVTLTAGVPSVTFGYEPFNYGPVTISATNDRGLSDPAALVFTCVASFYDFSGPIGGNVGIPSTNFTVALPGGSVVIGTVTVTPSDGGGGGTFTPATVGLTTGAPSATFTYTPASVGAKTLSVTNNGGLTDPSNLTYTVAVPGFYRSLTVDHTKVPATQTDFPVLVSITDATLKSVANSGHVQRSDGFDIGFFVDSAGTTPLKWEIEKYAPTTGELVAWVKIASLSSSADTVFYMRYGDPSITTDHSDPPNVWTNGFVAVYHLGNGTTLSPNDSRGLFNGVNNNSAGATTGKIDGAMSLTAGANSYLNLGHAAGFNFGGDYTLSAWVKATTLDTSFGNFIIAKDTNTGRSFAFGVKDTTLKLTFQSAGASTIVGATTIATGTTYFVAITELTGSGVKLWLNNAVDATVADTTIPNSATDVTIGLRLYPGNEGFWDGWIDEARICNVGRTTNWMTTEYNNQNAPGTFITVGAET